MKKLLKHDLNEDIAIEIIEKALISKENLFYDIKRDFFTLREFQRNKNLSEDLTKEKLRDTLISYSVAFANSKGGYLIFGVGENKENDYFITGIDYKNISRKKLLKFIDSLLIEIKDKLLIEVSFTTISVEHKDVYIFKIDEGKEKPYLDEEDNFFIRRKDSTLVSKIPFNIRLQKFIREVKEKIFK